MQANKNNWQGPETGHSNPRKTERRESKNQTWRSEGIVSSKYRLSPTPRPRRMWGARERLGGGGLTKEPKQSPMQGTEELNPTVGEGLALAAWLVSRRDKSETSLFRFLRTVGIQSPGSSSGKSSLEKFS